MLPYLPKHLPQTAKLPKCKLGKVLGVLPLPAFIHCTARRQGLWDQVIQVSGQATHTVVGVGLGPWSLLDSTIEAFVGGQAHWTGVTALRSLPRCPMVVCFHPVPVQAFTWGRSCPGTDLGKDITMGRPSWTPLAKPPLASGEKGESPWHLDVRNMDADEGFLPSYLVQATVRTVGGSVSSVIVLRLAAGEFVRVSQ